VNKIKSKIKLFNSILIDINDMIGFKSKLSKLFGFFLFLIPSLIFYKRILKFDKLILKNDISYASKWLLKKYYKGVEIKSIENIPDKSPLLIVCNHPGLGDATSVLSVIKRNDLKIVVLDKQMYKSLEGIKDKIIVIPEDEKQKLKSILLIVKHLKEGKSILLFAAGKIEKDPFFEKHSILKEWANTIGYLTIKLNKLNINFNILPILIENVLCKKSLDHKLVLLKKNKEEQEKSAALHIFLTSSTKDQYIKLYFGNLLNSNTLNKFQNSQEITNYVREKIIGLHKNL